MPDATYGFRFKFRKFGGQPTYQDLLFKDTETLTKGDMVNLESGEVDLAATNDSALLGAAQETISGTDSTTRIKVIVDEDAVYAVYDPNARLKGANLDISGTTGAMTVASSTNADLTVYAESAADEETLVMITHGEHADN